MLRLFSSTRSKDERKKTRKGQEKESTRSDEREKHPRAKEKLRPIALSKQSGEKSSLSKNAKVNATSERSKSRRSGRSEVNRKLGQRNTVRIVTCNFPLPCLVIFVSFLPLSLSISLFVSTPVSLPRAEWPCGSGCCCCCFMGQNAAFSGRKRERWEVRWPRMVH